MRALALSGGGSKGSYQVGVLKYLLQSDPQLEYDMVCGISVGALNAAGLLKFQDTRQSSEWLEDLWLRKVDKNNIYTRRSISSLITMHWKRPIYDSAPLRQLVETNIHADEIKLSGKKLAIGAVCLDTGEYYYASEHDENIHDWIIASASYPMFMDPVKIDGKLWADGQIKHITPIRKAIKMGATQLDVVLTSNFDDHKWLSQSKSSIPDQFIRTIDLMSSEIMEADVKFLKLKNWMVDTAVVTDIPYQKISARIIMPKQELISNSLDFKHSEIVRMFDLGCDFSKSTVITI